MEKTTHQPEKEERRGLSLSAPLTRRKKRKGPDDAYQKTDRRRGKRKADGVRKREGKKGDRQSGYEKQTCQEKERRHMPELMFSLRPKKKKSPSPTIPKEKGL